MERIKYTQITQFLSAKNITIVGVSRNPQDYSRNLYKELLKLNYNVFPVNPNSSEVDGHKCYSSVKEIPDMLDSAIILTPSVTLVNIVENCVSKGIRHIWVYNGNEKDENLITSYQICQEYNINFIFGFCPFMFLPDGAFPHRIHGKIAKFFGKYPIRN